MKRIMIPLLLASCAVEPPPGPTHAASWSLVGHSDSPGEPAPIDCTDVISHPCPLLLYMRRVDLNPGLASSTSSGSIKLVWWDGLDTVADLNGRTALDRPPLTETAATAPDVVELADRGDDAGLRHATAISRNADGSYDGDVAWSLFNVAGHTTFHLTITEISE